MSKPSTVKVQLILQTHSTIMFYSYSGDQTQRFYHEIGTKVVDLSEKFIVTFIYNTHSFKFVQYYLKKTTDHKTTKDV
jgi:hypothetical protein